MIRGLIGCLIGGLVGMAVSVAIVQGFNVTDLGVAFLVGYGCGSIGAAAGWVIGEAL